MGINGKEPVRLINTLNVKPANPNYLIWQKHCNGLYELPIAA